MRRLVTAVAVVATGGVLALVPVASASADTSTLDQATTAQICSHLTTAVQDGVDATQVTASQLTLCSAAPN